MKRYELNDDERNKIIKLFGYLPDILIFEVDVWPENLNNSDFSDELKLDYKNKIVGTPPHGLYVRGKGDEVVLVLSEHKHQVLFHEITHAVFYKILCDNFKVRSFYDLDSENTDLWYFLDEFIAEYYSAKLSNSSFHLIKYITDLKKGDYKYINKYINIYYPYIFGGYHYFEEQGQGKYREFKKSIFYQRYKEFIHCFEFDIDNIKILDRVQLVNLINFFNNKKVK